MSAVMRDATAAPAIGQPQQRSSVHHMYAAMPLERKLKHLESVPASMRALKQWLLFKLVPRESTPGKWDKVPYYINGRKRVGGHDSAKDQQALVDFTDATEAFKLAGGGYHGVGLAITSKPNSLACLDFDSEASVAANAKMIRSTWHERSVSGKGMHAFVINDGRLRNVRRTGYDVFTKGFIAVTGISARQYNPIIRATDDMVALCRDAQDDTDEVLNDTPSTPRSIARPWSPELAAELRASLKLLDSDMTYDKWMRVGMALHSADKRVDGPAFEMWKKWSQRGDKFQGVEDLKSHWRSFKPGGGVTVSTIFGMADDDELQAKRKQPTKVAAAQSTGEASTSSSEGADDDVDEDWDTDPGRATAIAFDIALGKRITWIWPGRIPQNELTLVAGEGGVGKGNVLCAIAAALVQGRPLPPTGNEPCSEFERVLDDTPSDSDDVNATIDTDTGEIMPMGVLWMSAEDDIGTVLIPRLAAAGVTNKDPLFFETGLVVDGDKRSLSLVEDLRLLKKLVKELGVKVLVIDPITAYLSVRGARREVDTHNASQLRSVLSPLNDLARECGVTVIAVTHFGKDATRSLVHRINGSATWAQFARSVLVAIEDPNGSGRVLLPVKSNSGRMAKALRYSIEEVMVDLAEGVKVPISRCEWHEVDPDITEANLIAHPNAPSAATDTGRIDRWLRDRLTEAGETGVLMTELRDDAVEQGFNIAKNGAFDRARRNVSTLVSIDGRWRVRLT